MKKILLKQLLISSGLYAFVYFFRTFVIFEFRNPFQWIIDIPSYSPEARFLLLFLIICYYSITLFIIYVNNKKILNK